MKTVRIFLLLQCLATSFYTHAAEAILPLNGAVIQESVKNDFHIWKINRATIDAQKTVIRNYLKRNARDRVIVRVAVASALAAGVGYWYWNYYRTPTPPAPGVKISVDSTTLQEIRDGYVAVAANLGALQDAAVKHEKALEVLASKKFNVPVDQASKGVAAAVAQAGKDAVTGTYRFVHGIGYYFYQNLPAVVAGGFVNLLIFRDLPTMLDAARYCFVRPIRKINHPHSLEWFLVTQAKVERARYRIDIERPYPGENNENVGYRLNYDKFFGNISRTAAVLPLASDEFERGHYVASAVADLNFLLRQVARIIAFCEIRTEKVSAHNKTCGRHLEEETAYVLKLTEKLGNDVASLLASQESHVKIPAIIEDFKFKMAEQLESFSLYEQAAFLDFTPAE
jgi:hypothetical protein